MFKDSIKRLTITYFGVGFSRICPGTLASILTLPLWFIMVYIIEKLNLKMYIVMPLLIGFLFYIGYRFTEQYLEETKKEDPSEVVIDEVVGQLLAFVISFSFMFFLKNKTELMILITNYGISTYIYFLVLPIVLFRIYDIKKPWIIGKIDSQMKNAMGVMLDDVVGGVFAGLTNSVLMLIFLQIIFFLIHSISFKSTLSISSLI